MLPVRSIIVREVRREKESGRRRSELDATFNRRRRVSEAVDEKGQKSRRERPMQGDSREKWFFWS